LAVRVGDFAGVTLPWLTPCRRRVSRCRRRCAPSATSITPRLISGRPGTTPGFTWRAGWAASAAPLRTEPLSSNYRASEVPRIPCSVPSAFAASLGPSAVRPFSLFCSGPFSAWSLFLPGPFFSPRRFWAPFWGPLGFPLFRFSWFLRPTVSSFAPRVSGRGPGAPSGSPRSRRDSFRELSSHPASSDLLQRVIWEAHSSVGRRTFPARRRRPFSKYFASVLGTLRGRRGPVHTGARATPLGQIAFRAAFRARRRGPYGAHISCHRNRTFLLHSSRLGPEMLRLHSGG